MTVVQFVECILTAQERIQGDQENRHAGGQYPRRVQEPLRQAILRRHRHSRTAIISWNQNIFPSGTAENIFDIIIDLSPFRHQLNCHILKIVEPFVTILSRSVLCRVPR